MVSNGNNREEASTVVTVNPLKHGELLNYCVCNLSCLLCLVLWIHAVSDHAAPGPLRAHATYLSTEWGSWPCICVRQWGKGLLWTFIVQPIRFPGQGKHHRLRPRFACSCLLFFFLFNVAYHSNDRTSVWTGFSGPVGERHSVGDECHRTSGRHHRHPRWKHGQGQLWQQDQWPQGKATMLIPL